MLEYDSSIWLTWSVLHLKYSIKFIAGSFSLTIKITARFSIILFAKSLLQNFQI